MKKTILRKYAELLVKSGIALKKGQSVLIQANVDIEDFTSLVVEECYRNGAKRVVVNWSSEKVNKINNKKASRKALAEVLPFEEAMAKWQTDDLPCLLWLDSDNPDALAGVDAKKLAYAQAERMKILYPYRKARENRYQWCIAGVASKAWAKKVWFSNFSWGLSVF